MRGAARSYDELRAYVETVHIIDCHDHSDDHEVSYPDALNAVTSGYFGSDIQSASSDREIELIRDASRPLEERWPVFERAWKRACHTGYAQVTKRVMKRFYGEEAMTLDALKRMNEKLINITEPAAFEEILEEAGIAARIENAHPDAQEVLDGTYTMSPRGRIVIPLPDYHAVRHSGEVQDLVRPLGRHVTSLGEYLEACREIFEGYKRFGAAAFKDQSAYSRSLAYGNPGWAEAESVFNWMMADPRRRLSYPDAGGGVADARPLDDFLFHEFMRMARDMDLPVQIHTGHMAGIRNDIAKTNAVRLTSVIELHREVRFDLFHANWPYGGDWLFLAKNYPNVTLDFCWANIIDPIYCQRLFKQVISAVPHGKVHGYGSDFGGQVDRAWAHASIARDNIAIALSDLVEMEYLDFDEAKEVARAWLFENANAYFRLSL